MNLEVPSSQLRLLKKAGSVSCYDCVLGLVGFVSADRVCDLACVDRGDLLPRVHAARVGPAHDGPRRDR